MADVESTAAQVDTTYELALPRPMPYWRQTWWRLSKNKVALGAAAVILLVLLAVVFAPFIAPYGPLEGKSSERLAKIGSPGHILGTDEQGRDMLTRLMYGGRMTLLTGVTPVIVALIAGSILGITAGFVGGRINTLIMRTADIFYAFPAILLALAISGSLGPGLKNALIAIAVVLTPRVTRVAEAVTTQIRGWDFVEAARASGASTFLIARKQIAVNVVSPILVYTGTDVGISIILASGLSFLGLGISVPQPEWGLMLNTLRTSIYVNPWVAALPGAMIFITVMSFNLLSEGLRDALDVKL